jgi:wobble nucleotide-excising tRNase
MKQVYGFLQGPGAPHTQTSATKTDPGNGPAKFKKYEENAGGARILTMLEDVMADSKKSEDDAHASETDAQAAYENLMKDSNKSITDLTRKITNMSEALSKSKESLSLAKADLMATVGELGELNDVAGDLHKSCDYLMKNFDARQAARAAEIDAMIEAKNILSGMK